ncbi:MAG: hypothetical protein GY849_17975 [Deltaproteobacteria bacterium]|nr:hypothetical protein [Deltaproteobacteria bacterium]
MESLNEESLERITTIIEEKTDYIPTLIIDKEYIMTTSTTLPENTKLIFERDMHCEDCGKSLEGKHKYYKLGDPKWKCEECYNK